MKFQTMEKNNGLKNSEKSAKLRKIDQKMVENKNGLTMVKNLENDKQTKQRKKWGKMKTGQKIPKITKNGQKSKIERN